MVKHNFGCPYKLASITGTRYSGSVFCSYKMSLEQCDGRYRYENNNGNASCNPLGLIILPTSFTITEEEKAKREELMKTVDSHRPPGPKYTMAVNLPGWVSIDSVPITAQKLMHGLTSQGVVEWVKK